MSLNLRKTYSLFKNNGIQVPFRCFASPATLEKRKNRKNPPKVVRIESVGTSLAAKGFLRSNKPYVAPQNAADKIKAICESLKVSTKPDTKLSNMDEKFKLLNACFKDFNHSVPNSQIHELNTIGDVIAFYQTSVDTTVPLDAMKKMELPENLHIQYEYIRFNPETDTKFNGKTAFPKSSTLVTGLKYRGKYEGHEAKRSWP